MQDSMQSPNPLRPYYIPPTIGNATNTAANSTANASKPSSSPFSFPDIDYSDYISDGSQSVAGSVKHLLDEALWKYASVLMGQPFEVAKLILQVRVAQDDDGVETPDHRSSPSLQGEENDKYEEENSSDDEPNYFTSAAMFEQAGRDSRRGRPGRTQRQSSSSHTSRQSRREPSPSKLRLRNPHSLMETLSALSSNSGSLAMWRATNSTFIYSVLTRALEGFFRSFLAALFGVAEGDALVPLTSGVIPDASILASTSPLASILISTAAAAISGLVLAPIDAARTRIILTPSTLEPRTLLGTLRTLSPAYLVPAHLIPITFLTSSIPTLISSSTPILLKSYLRLDPAMNPSSWSFLTFMGSALDLSVKFPLETVLRRAQISTWTSPSYSPPTTSSKRKAVKTIVPVPQSYRGVLPTIWSIVREEGYSESQRDKSAAILGKTPRRRRQGQGIEGLYRGWRVGLWGLVGIWGTSFMTGLQSGSEATTDNTGVHGGKF